MNSLIHLTLLIPLLYSISCEQYHSDNDFTLQESQVLQNLNQDEASLSPDEEGNYEVNSPVDYHNKIGRTSRRDVSRGTGRDWKLRFQDQTRELADRQRYIDRQLQRQNRRKRHGQRRGQYQGQRHEQRHGQQYHPQDQQPPFFWENSVYETHTNPYPQYQEYYHPYGPSQGPHHGGYNYDYSYQVERTRPEYEPMHMQFGHYRNPNQGSNYYPSYGPPNSPQWFGERYRSSFSDVRMVQHGAKPKSKSRSRSRSRSRSSRRN